jgi:hypothetical protein
MNATCNLFNYDWIFILVLNYVIDLCTLLYDDQIVNVQLYHVLLLLYRLFINFMGNSIDSMTLLYVASIMLSPLG